MVEEIVITRKLKDFSDNLLFLKKYKKRCDATVIINGERIEVHANVLAASSDFFMDVFIDKDLNEASFQDINKENIESLIQFCYTGQIKINNENVKELIMLASLISFPIIVDNCLKFLERSINISNCISTMKIAHFVKSDKLMKVVSNYIKNNFEELTRLKYFLTLEYSDIYELLKLKLNVSEVVIYNSAKRWISHDVTRKTHLIDLLNLIKLECLPEHLILSETVPICDSNNDCYKKLIDALKSQKNISSKKCTPVVNTLVAVGTHKLDEKKSIEIFDNVKQEWVEIKNIYEKREQFTSVLFEEKLLLIGGLIDDVSVNTITTFDFKKNKTENFPPMKYTRYRPSAVKFEDCIFVIGGKNLPNNILNVVEKWDPKTNVWKDVAPLITARCEFGAKRFGDEIFVIGGVGKDGYLVSAESYNPHTNSWRKCAPLNTNRGAFGIAALHEYIYVMGGFSGSGALKSVERYSPLLDKWEMFNEFSGDPRYWLSGGNLNGNLIIAGGFFKDIQKSDVDVFDEKDKKWKSTNPLKKSRAYLQLVEIPSSLAEIVLTNNKP